MIFGCNPLVDISPLSLPEVYQGAGEVGSLGISLYNHREPGISVRDRGI